MKSHLLTVLFGVSLISGIAQSKLQPILCSDSLSHDIASLPMWGPYSKRYAGISNIPAIKKGLRFDFSVMPGYYRNKLLVPDVLFESGYYPWEFAPDMNSYTYRYQLEWKDKLYADVSYHVLDSTRTLVGVKFVNNTALNQNTIINAISYIDFPEAYPIVKASGDSMMQWIRAIDYARLEPLIHDAHYRLVTDGWMRNEALNNEALSRSVVAKGFGATPGDWVSYTLGQVPAEGRFLFRIKLSKGTQADFKLSGVSSEVLHCAGTGDFEFVSLPFRSTSTKTELTLTAITNTAVEFDGFYIAPLHASIPKVTKQALAFAPKVLADDVRQNLILKYAGIDNYYGIGWNNSEDEMGALVNGGLESFLRKQMHNHVSKTLTGDKGWHYSNVFLRPIALQPNSKKQFWFLLCTGSQQQVEKELTHFHADEKSYAALATSTDSNTDAVFLPGAEQYATGTRLLQASLFSNISYPIYTQKEYIRHFAPGKLWNSLYTWDSGFIAWALTDIDPQKAYEVLKAYTTPVGSQSLFVLHGTPLPIQIFACMDLWNNSQNTEMLRFMYPRLKQYCDFMLGETPSSTTRMQGSGLLKSWDYFYNSGGWDDYPPQKYYHQHTNSMQLTPVITSALYLRAAKCMRLAACELGRDADVRYYERIIKKLTLAIQINCWDKQAGYFSYTMHDSTGNAIGAYTYPPDGSNFNKGLDGVSPLIAGICSSEQQQHLLGHLFSEKELWTPYGISTVDQSASYYRNDGYWNGTVWMPHQWLIWKALLDCGESEKARKVAETALKTWEQECENSNYTFEHFLITSGRGAGWHQFSGLSSPILNWYNAYFRIGKISTGFEIWMQNVRFNSDFSELHAHICIDNSGSKHTRSLIVNMNPDFSYRVTYNNLILQPQTKGKGSLTINLPVESDNGTLLIEKMN